MALLHVNFYSDQLGTSMGMDVILPEIDSDPAPWKTLYLLHGMTDDQTIWQRRTSIERYADEKRLAVVMPSTRLGWYSNTQTGENYFNFVSDELVSITRRMFPRLSHCRKDSFVAGLSMGGYGALKCALSRPDTFSMAASLSGAVDALGVTRLDDPLAGQGYWHDLFGEPEAIPGSPNDLFALAERIEGPKPKLFMWCGTEDFLYDMNLRMRDHLSRLGFDLKYSQSTGDHQWKYWDREIQNVLNWMIPSEEVSACR